MTCTAPLVSACTWAFSVALESARRSGISIGATVRRWELTEENRSSSLIALSSGSESEAGSLLRTVIGNAAARPVVCTRGVTTMKILSWIASLTSWSAASV